MKMQEIYLALGEIVEVSQVIEYNLATLIKYNEYIKKFKDNHKLSKRDYDNFFEEVEVMYTELNSSTLGQIINKLKEVDIFNSSSIQKLYDLLKERNYLVHRFFKDNNFNEIKVYSQKYNDICKRLQTTFLNMQDINYKLCEIIKGMQIEFSNISKR